MFFLLRTDQLSEYSFEYLTYDPSKNRLDNTKVHGKSSKVESTYKTEKKDRFCVEYMTKNVFTLQINATVDQAYKLMTTKEVRHLPITKDGLFVGIVSVKDILTHLSKPFHEKIKVSEIMSKVVICCDEETPIKFLAHVMVNEKISTLVVVDQSRQIKGVISYIDILRSVIDS